MKISISAYILCGIFFWCVTLHAEDQKCAKSASDYFANPNSKMCSYSDEAADSAKEQAGEEAIVENQAPGEEVTGVVTQVLQAAEYTYLLLDTKGEKIWIATNKLIAKKGDMVSFNKNDPFENFPSKTLKRTFKEIYLLNTLTLNGKLQGTAPSASDAAKVSEPVAISPKESTTGSSPKSLADLIAQRERFKNQTLSVMGRVTKLNNHIMGKNWVHISDKSLQGKKQDITVTTMAEVKVGDQIQAKGVVALDRDIGAGYFFPVLIEDAEVKEVKR